MYLDILLQSYMAPILLSFDYLHHFTVTFRRKLNLSEHRSFHVATAYSLTKNRALDNLTANLTHPLKIFIHVYIYIYIYIKERERERVCESNSLTFSRILIFP